MSAKYRFRAVPGIFLQSDASVDLTNFDFIEQNFGLIIKDTTEDVAAKISPVWPQLAASVTKMNKEAAEGTCYKLVFAARHGQGYHNAAIDKYGDQPWENYWSKQDGDEHSTWADAHLTELGVAQATQVSELWRRLIPLGVPLPQSYYVSPLDRCLATARHTWAPLQELLVGQAKYDPLVKEKLREVLGVHTCDRRSSKSYIEKTFPEARIEPGFSEEDLLWKADHRETDAEIEKRVAEVLEDIVEHDANEVYSITCHSGTIATLLRVLGHRPFYLATGAVVPVVMECVRL